ncbi:MAG: hypothetical protein H8E44_00705 [Planctomycetes bacterium]|nr:hypothetical protein [Planctomycetota bacterium]
MSKPESVDRSGASDGSTDGWPCACVLRDSEGNLDAIKIHPITSKRCRVCDAERPELGKYYCSACGQLLDRDSEKAWIKSCCERAERTVRIHRV